MAHKVLTEHSKETAKLENNEFTKQRVRQDVPNFDKGLAHCLSGRRWLGELQSKWHSQVEKRVISNTSRIHQGSGVRMRQALSASPCSPSVKHVETQTTAKSWEREAKTVWQGARNRLLWKSGRMTSGRWTATLFQNKNCRTYKRAALKNA